MTKKIILAIFVIVALVSYSVYATELDLTPSTSASDLQNTPLVGTDGDTETPVLTPTTTAEDLQNTSVVNTDSNDGIMLINDNPDEEGGYISPDMWRYGEVTNDTFVEGDTVIAEDTINVLDKQFNGNVVLVGAKADLESVMIFGDLFILTQAVNIKDINVAGNIYLAGQSAVLESVTCSGNMYLAGSAINMLEIGAQDIFVAGSVVTLDQDSYVLRNLYVAGTTVTIGTAEIGRDANISANDIQVSDSATIGGNLNKDIKSKEEKENASLPKFSIASVASAGITAIAICGFIVLFGNNFIEKQKSDNVAGYLLKNLGKGLLFAILVPIIAFLLLLTGVAIGLSLTIILIYIAIFAVSTSVVSVALTANLTKNMEYSVWRFYGISIVIAIVIAILKQIPIISGFVTFIVALTGMGLVFSVLKKKKENKNEVVATTEN